MDMSGVCQACAWSAVAQANFAACTQHAHSNNVRTRALAVAGGGAWAGRAWSPDLPNDSLLVLYLFAAFLDAPGWEFGAGMGPGGSSGAAGAGDDLGRGMPLFLGG